MMSNKVSSDQLTLNFSSLVIEMKVKIFFLLSADDLQNCREVCEEWNSFILQNIWNHPIIVERRLSRNWSMEDTQYVKTQEVLNVDESAPFVRAATEDYVVVQNFANLDVSQHLSVYQLKTKDVWRTEKLGPNGHRFTQWTHLKVHINKEILAVCYKSKDSPGQYTVKVWSTSSHELIMEENILGFCDSLFETSKSMLILFQTTKVEVLAFNTERLVSRQRCDNELPLFEWLLTIKGSKNCFPYILYWQRSDIATQMFVWNLDVEENKVETHLHLGHFPVTAADALYVSSCFIVVEAGGKGIVVINEDGGIVRKLNLGSFGNCRILFNQNRLFAKTYRMTYEDYVLMCDLREIVKNSGPGFFYKLMDDIKFEKLVYDVPEAGGDDYGFVISNTFIYRVAVVSDGVGNWSVMMRKLNFLLAD